MLKLSWCGVLSLLVDWEKRDEWDETPSGRAAGREPGGALKWSWCGVPSLLVDWEKRDEWDETSSGRAEVGLVRCSLVAG